MRKVYILAFAALAITAASCTREQVSGTDTVILKVNIPELQKTSLGEKSGDAYPNYWSEGDQINVNGVESEALGAAFAGKTSAEFTVSSVTAPYYAVYPAVAATSYTEGSGIIEIPDEQEYVAGSYDPNAYVMIGKSSVSSVIDLAPVVSILHVKLTGSSTIKAVAFAGAGDGDVFSGTFNTDYETLGSSLVFSNYAEVSSTTGVALPADFYVCVKSGNPEGLSLIAVADDGTRMVKDFNVKKAFEPGKMYNVGEYEYVGEEFFELSAGFITSSTVDIAWDTPNTKSYLISVYSDPECTALVKSYDIPDNDGAANDCWYGNAPKFCVSGLAAGTTYYIVVKNVTDEKESDVLEVETLPFTIVEVSDTPAEVGDVILAEDFSELEWHADMIGEAAGWSATSAGQKSFAYSPSVVGKWQRAKSESEKQLNDVKTAVAASRLAHWAQGANTTNAVHPGYVKLVASSKITHLVTPSLTNIPEGKSATLEVTLTTSPHYSASESKFETDKAILAVQPSTLKELTEDTNTNTLDFSTNAVGVTLALTQDWTTQTITLDNVPSGARIAFGPASDIVGNNGRMALSDISVKIVDLKDNDPTILVAAAEEATSSTLCFSWTHPNDASFNDDAYEFGLYTDPECTNAVDHFETAGGQSYWNKNSKGPKFIFGRLAPGTTYYFKVVDTDTVHGNEAAVVSGTTKEFTPVTVSSTPVAVGGTMLAENFGEMKWDFSQAYKAVGFFPSDLSDFANSANPTFRKPYDGSEKQFYNMGTPLAGTRLDDWAVDSNVYIHPGHLKLGTSSAKGWVLTPELVVPAGNVAKVNVTVTAAIYDSSQETKWGVGVITDAGVPYSSNAHRANFSWGPKDSAGEYDPANYQEVTLGTAFKTITVEGLLVSNGNRVVFGAKQGGDASKSRAFLSEVKVDVVEYISMGGELTISDAATLLEFAEAVNGGKVMVTGNVTSDITLSAGEAAALPEISGFDGVLNGNGHTISGLVKPLFASIETASISSLKLSGSFTDSATNFGILARTSGAATITSCETSGTIEMSGLNASAINVAGMVGNTNAKFTECTNNASINIASGTVSGAIYLGGICANAQSSASMKNCHNTGNIETNIAAGGDLQIGGVAAGDLNTALDGCSNTGNIYIGANVGSALYCGGVLGYHSGGKNITNCTNGVAGSDDYGKISCKSGITLTKQIFVGGILGAEADKKEATHSNLVNYGDIRFEKVKGSTSKAPGYSYIGGCGGGKGTTYSQYINCENYGDIYYTGVHYMRLGGIVAYTSKNPRGSVCKADIYYVKAKDTIFKSNSHVGGVMGYCSDESEISDLYFRGSIHTQSSDPRALVGGITGVAKNTVIKNCRVATTMLDGAGDSDMFMTVGLICSIEAEKTTSFEYCKIEAGSKRGKNTIELDTPLVLNVGAEGNAGGLCGGAKSGDYPYLSIGTMTGCEVVESIDE